MGVRSNAIVFQFTDVNGTLQTLQCDFGNVEYGGSRAIAKYETFCAVEKVPGNVDNSIDVQGLFNASAGRAHTVLQGLKTDGTARLYKYGPAGSGTGAVLLSGVAFLADYKILQKSGGQVEVRAKFDVVGDDVATTW